MNEVKNVEEKEAERKENDEVEKIETESKISEEYRKCKRYKIIAQLAKVILSSTLKILLIAIIINIMQLTFEHSEKIEMIEEACKDNSISNLQESISESARFWQTTIADIAIVSGVYLFIAAIIKNKRASSILTASIFLVFEIINYIVLQVRGFEVTISDIYLIRTAAGVAKGITVKFNQYFYIGIGLFALICASSFIVYKKKTYSKNEKELLLR